jgi:AcrR family transcriptional regulator
VLRGCAWVVKVAAVQRRRSDPTALVHAARGLFVRHGVQKTSMDDVAREAGVSKGSVYLAFASKDALFRAVCVDVCTELEGRVQLAVERVSSPRERLLCRLEAKYGFLHELLSTSPHAAELLHSKDALARDVLQRLDEAFRDGLAEELAAAGLQREGLHRAAAMLVRVARGCAQADEGEPATTTDLVRRRVREAAAVMLAGLLGDAP